MLNITQHTATKAQLQDGVIEPTPEIKAQIQKLLTFAPARLSPSRSKSGIKQRH